MVALTTVDMNEATLIEKQNPLETTFTQALKDKYVNQEVIDNGLVLPRDKIISTDITFVGFSIVSGIQRQLHRLTNIDLSSNCIVEAGDDLGGSIRNIRTLNLANNSLPWHQVAMINSYLPNLRELILTGNKLDLNDKIETLTPAKSLNSITLGRTNLDWSSVINFLSKLWLHVEQIDLWDNNLCSERMVLQQEKKFEFFTNNIHVLKLSHNYFPNLEFLNTIGSIHNLTELDVSNCKITSLNLCTSQTDFLRNLRVLNISHNNLSNWRCISSLHQLPKLENLSCHENPIFITEKFARPFTVGRLGQLKVLNREEVNSRVRRDFELLYLRKTFPQYQSSGGGSLDEFFLDHPRYEELLKTYGIPEDLTKAQVIDKYINVQLCLDEKTLVKKLPCDMRIANVRMLCKKLFKLKPSSSIRITCDAGSPNDDINYVLDKDGQTLDFFSVKNGHKLLIELNDQ